MEHELIDQLPYVNEIRLHFSLCNSCSGWSGIVLLVYGVCGGEIDVVERGDRSRTRIPVAVRA